MVISEETLKARALFSQRLGILLNKHDMKQNELAAFLGVSESTVGKWILGKSMPRTMGLVQKIADHFGVGKSYLLENDNTSAPSPEPDRPSYYADPETAEVAERLRTQPGMRMLFDASKDAKPEDLQYAADLLKRLKGDE